MEIMDIFKAMGWTIITAICGFICEKLVVFINQKIKNDKSKFILNSVLKIVSDVVKEEYQTCVEQLKADNEFSTDKQIQVLEDAKSKILNQLSDSFKNYIVTNYGSLDAFIDTKIHSVLYDLKK